jgi:hypothetical protein
MMICSSSSGEQNDSIDMIMFAWRIGWGTLRDNDYKYYSQVEFELIVVSSRNLSHEDRILQYHIVCSSVVFKTCHRRRPTYA